MRIDSCLPTHIARAYGVKPASPTAPAHKLGLSSRVDTAARGGQVADLVAARVPGGIDPRSTAMPSMPSSSGDVLQLYTRAADRVEAAVSIQVGRSLDVTG